jgi:hypothetical protein
MMHVMDRTSKRATDAPVKAVLDFLGANLFLFAMLLVGAATVVALVKIARLAGADDDTVHWLVFPIGVVAIVAMAYAGKTAHRALARFF